MNALSRRWERWVGFFDEREPGAALALFRIACGLIVLGAVGSVVVHGLTPVLWLNREDGGLRPDTYPGWLFTWIGVTRATVWMVTAGCLVFAVLLVAGLGGRLTVLVALQSYLALSGLNKPSGGGDDRLLTNALWLLFLSRCTETLSLDCRRRTGRWVSVDPVPAWPRYLAVWQLVLVYFCTGMQKISLHWLPGGDLSALYYILQQPSWQRWDMTWLAHVYPLTQAATLATWLFEVLAPLLLLALWYRRTKDRPGLCRRLVNWLDYRRCFVLAGAAMHAGILLLMNVEPFSWVTLSFYLCLFSGAEWQALVGGRMKEEGGRMKSEAPASDSSFILHPSSFRSCWPHVRAALIALHLFAVTLLAFPAPPLSARDRSLWKNDNVQRELADWSARLRRWGWTISAGELEDSLHAATCKYLEIREALAEPFEPYYAWCGTAQSWRMFTGPDLAPARLHVEVEEQGTWRTVLVERDPHFAWLASRLAQHRMRALVFNLSEDGAIDEPFAAWLAEQAARDFPRADRLRIRYCRRPTPPPPDMRAGRFPPGWVSSETVVPLKKRPTIAVSR
jgi:hypothetical protein